MTVNNIMKCQICGVGLVKCLPCKHEELKSLPLNQFFFFKQVRLGWHAFYNPTAWEAGDRQMLGVPWPASLRYFISSRPV